RTSIVPTAPSTSIERLYRSPSTDSTPGIARAARNAAIDPQSNGGTAPSRITSNVGRSSDATLEALDARPLATTAVTHHGVRAVHRLAAHARPGVGARCDARRRIAPTRLGDRSIGDALRGTAQQPLDRPPQPEQHRGGPEDDRVGSEKFFHPTRPARRRRSAGRRRGGPSGRSG